MKVITDEINAARKTYGLLTIREWLAKWWPAQHLPGLVGDFTLDGGRGFVPDEPPHTAINADGSLFLNCGGYVVVALPRCVCVSSKPPGCGGGFYAWERNASFYFVVDKNDDGRQALKFAESC